MNRNNSTIKKFLFLFATISVVFGVGYTVCLQASSQDCPLRSVEQVSLSYTKEMLNGVTFEHRIEVVNGKKKELWAMSGHAVEAQAYEEAILDAEKEVRRQERRTEQERLVREQEFKTQSLIALNKKMLNAQVVALENELKKMRDYSLDRFVLFDEKSALQSEQFERLTQKLLPQARAVLSAVEPDLMELTNLVAAFDGMPARVHELCLIAVNKAIAQCDDTQTLKKMLELVS